MKARILLSGLDKLHIQQQLTIPQTSGMTGLFDVVVESLDKAGQLVQVQTAAPALRTRLIQVHSAMIRLVPLGRGRASITAVFRPQDLHFDQAGAWSRVTASLAAIEQGVRTVWGDRLSITPMSIVEYDVHVDWVGAPIYPSTLDRIVNSSRQRRQPYPVGAGKFTGVTYGRLFGIYNKTLEIELFPAKRYIERCWEAAGYSREADGEVWRAERSCLARWLAGHWKGCFEDGLQDGLDKVSLRRKPRGRGGVSRTRYPEDPLWGLLRTARIPFPGIPVPAPPVIVPTSAEMRRRALHGQYKHMLINYAARECHPEVALEEAARLLLEGLQISDRWAVCNFGRCVHDRRLQLGKPGVPSVEAELEAARVPVTLPDEQPDWEAPAYIPPSAFEQNCVGGESRRKLGGSPQPVT